MDKQKEMEEKAERAAARKLALSIRQLEARRVKRQLSKARVEMLAAEATLLKTFDENQKELFKVYDEKRAVFQEIDKEFDYHKVVLDKKLWEAAEKYQREFEEEGKFENDDE